MKIVAKNSLTISNVNDGTITHTAYAYSADGKDRFTTVYPNLNLFTGTSDKPSKKTGGEWNIATIGVYKTPIVGQEYTISVEVPEADHDVMMEVFRWDNAGHRVSWPLATTRIKSGEKGHVTITWPDPKDSGAIQLAADLAWTNDKDTGTYSYDKAKLEIGGIPTPHMPSSSEVTTADWPSYIGQYTDYTQDDSTKPSDYTWSLIRGNDGKDGARGKDGIAGSNGDPGKVVSDTEPTTKFKGLTWKYSGITAINASDGTNIQPNTEYYWNGNNWVINLINAHNINVDDLSAISTTLTNGKFISNWSSSNATGTTTIEKNHLIINSANASLNTNNTIALDNEQGMMMTYTDTTSNRTVTAGVNFQGFFVTDSAGPYVSVTPTGIVNSVDVSWTTIGSYAAYRRDGKVVTIRVVGAKTSATGDIYIGKIPLKDCPTASVMGTALAWSASVANDKHIQINGLNQRNSGTVTILSAAANQEYTFQFTYQI
ncbi:hypothetical protein [Lactococcus lactis]|uniref:Uncharacterized protein n=1 Tax=Lactococcus lactis TaxID=1358 RepID=A0A6M0MAC6_9LACT|nr:hypothetical protein [Lactococcus lactis]NEX51122.1 hypothetical protein [Lactococcus lactis]NEX56434.1 hypothetical protein [Lactococcus lactis]